MRRLLAGILVVLPGAAAACSCERPSEGEQYARASHIFVARVTETKVIRASYEGEYRRIIGPELVRGQFTVLEVLKGTPNTTYVLGDKPSGGADCNVLHLLPGMTYLFVLSDGNAYVSACTSTSSEVKEPYSRKLDAFRKLNGTYRLPHELEEAAALEREGKGPEAVEMYARLARSGSGKAALRLGEIYAKGIRGVTPSYPESIKWLNAARVLGEDIPAEPPLGR